MAQSISNRAEESRTGGFALLRGLGWFCVLLGLGCAAPTLSDQRSMATVTSRADALQQSGAPRRVLLITVAGLESADFLNAWGGIAGPEDAVRMPALAALAQEGAIGIDVRTPTPGASYSAHATIATGRGPNGHGVIADSLIDDSGTRAQPFWDNAMLRGGALWDAAIGRGVISLGWPTTTGARIELVVPDLESGATGAGWMEAIRRFTTPSLMRELDQAAEAAVKNKQRAPGTWPSATEKDAAFVDLACSLLQSERDASLWLMRLSQTATAQVQGGEGSLAESEALASVDAEIGRLMACLEGAGKLADTAIFVAGDVAYRAVHTRVDPNVALVAEGLIGRDPRSSTGVRSWLAMTRSHGRSAYIYARDASNAVAARNVLEAEAEKTGAFEVISAKALAEVGGDPQAWFGLTAKPGFKIGNRLAGPLVSPASARASAGGFGLNEPSGSQSVGLLAWGRGIRGGVRIPSADLRDLAPTVASLLGLRLPGAAEGKPIIGLLRAAVPPPPPGPKRIGVDNDSGDVDRALRDLGGGRPLGDER
ncbi:MAG: alkaline phosphatase family protein [Myxococcota bacterium]